MLVSLTTVVLLIWLAPPALYKNITPAKDRASAEATTRTGLLAGLAGLAALGSLAMTAGTYRLTAQGQLTDRYTTAIAARRRQARHPLRRDLRPRAHRRRLQAGPPHRR